MNKEIRVFSSNYSEKLYKNLNSSEYYKIYLQDEFKYEENYPLGHSGIFLDENLKLDPGKSDFENSRILYENLELNETQASDKRLWTYLVHARFWDYMIKKWPADKVENPINRIKDRYFLNSVNIQTLTRNGISRLWWYCHLTIDKGRKNHYELTQILLARQEIAVGLLERSLGSISCLRKAFLEYLKDNPTIMNNEDKTREVLKQLNLAGGVKNLSMLKFNEIRKILDSIPIEK